MVEIIGKSKKVLSTSHNLRGLIRFAGKNPVAFVRITEKESHSAILHVEFLADDFPVCDTPFASFSVLDAWVHNRRAFKGVVLAKDTLDGVTYETL